MDHLRALVALFAGLCSAPAWCAYTTLTPPPGWSPGGGAMAQYLGKPVSGMLNISSEAGAAGFDRMMSRSVATLAAEKVPVSFAIEKTAAQRMLAGRIGAALATGAGAAVFTGGLSVAAMLAVPIVAEWWRQTPYRWTGTQWVEEDRVLEGYWQDPYGNGRYASPDAACKSAWSFAVPERRSDTNYACIANGGSLGNVFRIGDESVVQKPVEFEPRVKSALEATPLPYNFPNIVWPASWPVSDPVINPDSSGNASPYFVPTGSPVKNPNYDPTQPISATNYPYIQPGIRVVPAPTSDNPWRVDAQPVDRPLKSPDDKDPPDDDKPRESESSLCEKHPDIVACQKLGTLDAKPLEKRTVTLAINREEGFGPVNGSCPAPRNVMVMGQEVVFKWDFFCQFAEGARPLIVGFAYLSAVLAFMGLSRKGD